MKKRNIILYAGLALLVAIAIPIVIDWAIIGNSVPSNISNSEWVGFLGGYIGSIIGAFVSLAGIILTIRFTSVQNKKDREAQNMPYCTFRYTHSDKIIGTKYYLGEFICGCEPQGQDEERYVNILYVKNIGKGPAISFDVITDPIDDGREHYPVIIAQDEHTENCSVDMLAPGEEAALPISFFFNFDPITKEDCVFVPDKDEFWHGYMVKEEVLRKYRNFKVNISIRYKDVFQNTYEQKIMIESNIYASTNKEDGTGKFKCDLHLRKTTSPEIVKAEVIP